MHNTSCVMHMGKGQCARKNISQKKKDHRSLWQNDDQSSKFVPIPNTTALTFHSDLKTTGILSQGAMPLVGHHTAHARQPKQHGRLNRLLQSQRISTEIATAWLRNTREKNIEYKSSIFTVLLTLMLLVSNLTNTKICKKKTEKMTETLADWYSSESTQ